MENVAPSQDIFKQATEDRLTSAKELPYFEGDFWPNVLEESIKELEQEEEERKKEESTAASDTTEVTAGLQALMVQALSVEERGGADCPAQWLMGQAGCTFGSGNGKHIHWNLLVLKEGLSSCVHPVRILPALPCGAHAVERRGTCLGVQKVLPGAQSLSGSSPRWGWEQTLESCWHTDHTTNLSAPTVLSCACLERVHAECPGGSVSFFL